MNLIFKNIPVGIKKYELAKFIETTFNLGNMTSENLYVPIGDINIWQTGCGDAYTLEQFGVVKVRQPVIAKQMVKKLNGCAFNKFKVIVREFFSRSENNDPRLGSLDVAEVFKEQRIKDRREHNLLNLRQL